MARAIGMATGTRMPNLPQEVSVLKEMMPAVIKITGTISQAGSDAEIIPAMKGPAPSVCMLVPSARARSMIDTTGSNFPMPRKLVPLSSRR